MKVILVFSCLLLIVVGFGTWSLAADFNGDGSADLAVFRPAAGLWAVRGITRVYFGTSSDTPLVGDFDGDGTSDIALYRPLSGMWAVSGGTRVYFGGPDDNPVPDDYDGDGTDDFAIYRGSSGLWAVRGGARVYFGGSSDTPIAADYDGDGKADIGIRRESSGLWAVRGVTRVYYGSSTDHAVPGDYDGDGRCEIAVMRPSIGLWAVRGVTRVYFGSEGDRPQPADYDGDGTEEVAVFRPENGIWAVRGVSRSYYGGLGDVPVTSPVPRRVIPLPYFGIELIRRNADEFTLPKLGEAGASVTRMNFISWAEIEPRNTTPEDYYWEVADSEVGTYVGHGLTPIMIIADIPTWTGSVRCGPIDDEALDDFAEFVGAVVRRYKDPPYNIKYWEFFNEPDGTVEDYGSTINCWGYHGAGYARMLQAVYPVVKAADPEARVLLGGLAHDSFTDEGGIFYREFLNDVIENGGGPYFDILNFHYYYFTYEYWGGIIGKTESLRNVLASYGLQKPIICSEVGIWGDEANRERQARYVPQVFSRGMAAGLESVLWFPLVEGVTSFLGGLLYQDLSPKPAYLSYRTMTDELSDYSYTSPAVTGSSNIEGYEFIDPGNGKTKQLLWTVTETDTPIEFEESRIRAVFYDGTEYIINDGGPGDRDGQANGRITAYLTPDPVYVEAW